MSPEEQQEMAQKILKDTEASNRRLKIRMYKLMGKMTIFGGLNLEEGYVTWLKVEEINDENGENSSSLLGLKYNDCSLNGYWPLTREDLDTIAEIADRHGYTFRTAVPREMKEGFILVLMPK